MSYTETEIDPPFAPEGARLGKVPPGIGAVAELDAVIAALRMARSELNNKLRWADFNREASTTDHPIHDAYWALGDVIDGLTRVRARVEIIRQVMTVKATKWV